MQRTTSYEDLDIYCLGGRDRELVRSALDLLKKVIAAKTLRPAEMVSVSKVLHLWSRLPKTSATEMIVNVSVIGPRRQFGEIQTFHWWDVGVEGRELSIASGGHFYQPSTGGDTFSTMSWTAEPGEESVFADYRDDLTIVPDVQSFQDAVAKLDLTNGEYKFEITDTENPLLEEIDESNEEESVNEETAGESQSWSVQAVDASEKKLAALVKPDEVEANEPQFAYGVDHCDACGGSLASRSLFVDGAMKGQIGWANMCAECFEVKGAGIGWGSGRLYAKQANGEWRLVAGFKLQTESDEDNDEY